MRLRLFAAVTLRHGGGDRNARDAGLSAGRGHAAARYVERLWRRPVLAIDSYRMGLGLQLIAAGDFDMTVGETIAVAVAVVDVAYVVWGYRLRTALDRTKRHTPLSTGPALRANWSDAAQDVARELAAWPATLRRTRPTPQLQAVDAAL
jgi:hypothetical protein